MKTKKKMPFYEVNLFLLMTSPFEKMCPSLSQELDADFKYQEKFVNGMGLDVNLCNHHSLVYSALPNNIS